MVSNQSPARNFMFKESSSFQKIQLSRNEKQQEQILIKIQLVIYLKLLTILFILVCVCQHDNCCTYNIIERMSFAKQQKKLNEQVVFNPPPGYYESDSKGAGRHASSFGRSQRFVKKEADSCPGPGAYNDNHKQQVRKRLIEESQKRDVKGGDSGDQGNIKISSIPSIPKKSATRVYEQLAPGILILHEEEYENTSIGPGSYNVTDKLLHPKPKAHRIPPEHKKKPVEQEPIEVNVPTIAQEIRNQRRMMYKQNLAKASTVNKSEISPSDLCLEVIILRQKLLRSDENPPPGYYHNENLSSFKPVEAEQRPAEVQCLGGKEKRFQQQNTVVDVGPGSYKVEEDFKHQGGFISKQPRKIHELGENKPGPGAYIAEKSKPKVQSKASYPPIFGSGCMRFTSAPKTITPSIGGPGPGAYQIEKRKNKKQKYIKIKRQFLEPTRESLIAVDPVLGIQSDVSHATHTDSVKQRKFYPSEKHSSNFASKVQRFGGNQTVNEGIAPGNYDVHVPNFSSKSFNKRQGQEGYLGCRVPRFDQSEIRPKIGPGTYNPAYQTVKEKKIMNVFL